jgi:UDP-2-acetamido-3-amino-2,3-dideoxy-glucuronate N-acetyltransferase
MAFDVQIHPTAVVDAPVTIGAGTKIWHFTHVMSGAVIGERCVLGQGCFVSGRAVIGAGVKLQNNVSVFDGVELEDEVFCGPSAVFTNVVNPRAAYPRKHEYRPTLVRRGATIGANATVLPGLTVGEHAFIGAGATVIRDVAAFGLVVGVPARQIGWVSRNGERLAFDARGRALCPATGAGYTLLDGSVVADDP